MLVRDLHNFSNRPSPMARVLVRPAPFLWRRFDVTRPCTPVIGAPASDHAPSRPAFLAGARSCWCQNAPAAASCHRPWAPSLAVRAPELAERALSCTVPPLSRTVKI
jgi:hypothetical protein